MSPRASSTTTASPSSSTARAAQAPYPARRSVSHPKSTRQQFSACGACRMRRVRCDLKDLAIPTSGPHPTCSNCKERGIKCVDEFADVKAVKLLRRGRRLQQVEAIYGKSSDSDTSGLAYSTRLANAIPNLHQDFFCSQFWRWFCIQRPILDATEFPARFLGHQKGERALGPEGGIITMLLVTWAFSYRLNECGTPLSETEAASSTPGTPPSDGLSNNGQPRSSPSRHREQLEQMVQQILDLVDYHGVMRRPTFDGVRALLLLLPLLEDAKPLERLVIHDVAMSQVQALCTLGPATGVTSRPTSYGPDDSLCRSRLFWYAYTNEGLSTGLRGGRFNLHREDYQAFQRTIPSQIFNSSLPSPQSPASIHAPPLNISLNESYNLLASSSAIPLQLNEICRNIHASLTGPRAARRAEEHGLIDALGMREIWRDLDQCWRELSSIRRNAVNNEDSVSRCDTERYACAWQIFIFECHNVIRESLKQYMSANPQHFGTTSRPSSHSSGSSPYLPPDHLHLVATRKCLALLPRVIRILQFCVTHSTFSDKSGIFTWDSGLVRDGCFYAAYLAASTDEDMLEFPHDVQNPERDDHDLSSSPLSADEGVALCLGAISSKRWLFSKSDEREETIRMIWEARKSKRHGQSARYGDMGYDAAYANASGHLNARVQDFQPQDQSMLHATVSFPDRTMLPTLNVFTQPRRTESAPTTACTTDGQGSHGWPSYTPPGTATSLTTTSTGTGFNSLRGSPEFANVLTTYKTQNDEAYYHSGGELDPFAYNVSMGGSSHPSEIPPSVTFPTRHSPAVDPNPLANGVEVAGYVMASTTTHFAPNMLNVASNSDYQACPQFGDNCNGHPYH